MSLTEALYFVAVLPPEKITGDITAIKKEFAGKYESRKALKVLPHITIKAPFKLPVADDSFIKHWFTNMTLAVDPFSIQLNGFGMFNNNDHPVIFIEPTENKELNILQKQVLDNFRKSFPQIPVMYPEWHFKPHITIGYRDLSLENFNKAWQVYEKQVYTADFWIDSIYLLKHDRRQWNVIQSMPIKREENN